MMTARRVVLPALLALALAPSRQATAAYPTFACVSAKTQAASTSCKVIVRAWAKWERRLNDGARDAALAAAAADLAAAWGAAEAASAAVDVDCADTTLSAAGMSQLLQDNVAGVVALLNDGIDLATHPHNRACGSHLLKAAAIRCRDMLAAQGAYIADPTADPQQTTRNAAQDRSRQRFARRYNSVATVSCPNSAPLASLEGLLDGIVIDVTDQTTRSPNVPGNWTMITPPTDVPYLGNTLHPICSHGTPWVYFAKRGTVNKLLVYYQGGGACWDYLTCALPAFKEFATAGDNPANTQVGFGDLSNPLNPFKDWNAVFVTYCTGDIHWGDASHVYSNGSTDLPIEHRGFQNAQVAEKYAREHFVDPDEVFVTGSSAGAYGAIMGGVYLRERVYPRAHFDVLADAGNGVITHQFQVDNLPNWGVEANLPTWIPELDKPIDQLSIDQLWSASANHYPNDRWAQYTSSYDGGSGSQSQFYQTMLNPDDQSVWLQWWHASCPWNAAMVALAQTTSAAAPNYRYYIGAGSRHTMWGSNKVYTDTKGGVPLLVDWVTAMLSGGPGWVNVQCTDCSLLPGTCSAASSNAGNPCQDPVDCPGGACVGRDPRPNPLQSPFGTGGSVTCP